MKTIIIIRHSDWDGQTDTLTKKGVSSCETMRTKLGFFDQVIASPFNRNIQTAQIISEKNPIVDKRAGILQMNSKQADWLNVARKNNSLGVAGAIFNNPELIESVKEAGQKLLDLIQEIIKQLPKDGRALIVSHDGTMVALEKLLKNKSFDGLDHTYGNIEGFVVDENLGFVNLANLI